MHPEQDDLHPCASVCVFTVLWGAVRLARALLVSNCALQRLHVGLEFIEQAPRPALSRFSGVAVVHPVGAAVT